MSWWDNMKGAVGVVDPAPAPACPPVVAAAPAARPTPKPPVREVEQRPTRSDEPVSAAMPWSFGAMMLATNEAYTDLIVGSKGTAKVDTPCGDCIESIAEQLMGA